MPDFSVHDADPGVHDDRSQRSRWSDFGVHDAPIRAFTLVRFPQQAHHVPLRGEWADLRWLAAQRSTSAPARP
jgi:hypothetical protein